METAMNRVEVFQTEIDNRLTARYILSRLSTHFPHAKITLDLEDCDRVLRIEGNNISADQVLVVMRRLNQFCRPLD